VLMEASLEGERKEAIPMFSDTTGWGKKEGPDRNFDRTS